MKLLPLTGAALLAWVPGLQVLPAAAPRSLPDCFDAGQVRWHLDLGSHQYTVPMADRGLLYLGINDSGLKHPAVRSSGGGLLLCLDQETGAQVWQLPVPRFMDGKIEPFHFNHWKCGVCSRPAVDGDRLYVVAPRGDILCLDRHGQADGNDGPFLDEARYMGVPAEAKYHLSAGDGDILWRYNLIEQAKVVPHDVCGSSPLVHQDYLYACTSNGVDGRHNNVGNPNAPGLVVLDKITGELVATDGALAGAATLHGHWSSPVLAECGDQPLILFGGGDGVLYAFEPWQPQAGGPGTLKLAWKHDCCPADYRFRDGKPIPYSRSNKTSPDGPSEIIATPVVQDGRVYVAIGQSPMHGTGKGMLSCLDARTGTVVWESRKVERTLSDVAIDKGLLFVPDYSGRLHCLDAGTGEHLWAHDLGSGVWSASPVIVDGNVYISTEQNKLWILKAAREPEIVALSSVRSMAITPATCGDILYLPTQRELFALSIKPSGAARDTSAGTNQPATR